MKRSAIFLTSFCLSALASAGTLERLCSQLVHGQSDIKTKKVAVLSFPYHDSKISSASSIIPERLTTYLVSREGVRVIERRLMQKILEEKKLGQSGVIDESSVKKVGSVLGVDAIVTGTLIDLDDGTTEINARMIDAGSGEIISAGRATMERVWADKPRMVGNFAKNTVSPRPERPRSMTDPSVAEPEDDGPIELPMASGKEMKLSNENFAPGRRNYYPVADPFKNVQKSKPYSTDRPEMYDNDPYYYNAAPPAAVPYYTNPVPVPPSFIDQRLNDSYQRMGKQQYQKPTR
jgi:TolB-like protein